MYNTMSMKFDKYLVLFYDVKTHYERIFQIHR